MQFYYRRSDQQFGPMSWGALVALARNGWLNPTDLVWAEGWESWQAASAVVDLLHVQAPLPARRSGCATAAGYFGLFALVILIASPLAQALLPVGGSRWAAGAGFLGLFVLAPLALLAGMLAVIDIRKHSEKHGMGRAIFATVIGGFGTCILLYAFLFAPAQSVQAQSAQTQESEWKYLHTEAESLYNQDQYDRALAIASKALKLAEETRGPNHPDVATSLDLLGLINSEQGHGKRAEPLLQRALTIREQALGPKDPSVVTTLDHLGDVLVQLGEFARAEQLLLRALAIDEKDINVTVSIRNLASRYVEASDYARAEQIYKQVLAITEKANGPADPDVAAALGNLAQIYVQEGEYARAESLLQRALAIEEKAHGPENPFVASDLYDLANLFYQQGQFERAEPLFLRALAINEKAYGDNADVATNLNGLALLYADEGQYARAEPLYQRVLAIDEKVQSPTDAVVATHLNNLAAVYADQGRDAQAESLYRRALVINEKAHGPDHPHVSTNLNNLASLYVHQRQYARAEPLLQRSLTIDENAFGPGHLEVAIDLSNLGALYHHQARYPESLTALRRATSIFRARFVNKVQDDRGGGLLSQQRSERDTFLLHLTALSHVYAQADHPAALAAEGFEVSQLARASSVGQSVAQMASRFSQRGDELAEQVRAQQDSRDQLARADKRLIEAIGQPPDERDAVAETELRKSIAALGHRLDGQNKAIAIRFPQYQSLVSQAPASAAEMQQLLHRDEALLVYTVSDKESYAWVLRPDRIAFSTMAIGEKELDAQVQFLRRKLQPNAEGVLAPMTPATSNRLYKAIFAPLESSLVGVKRVLIVPEGALQSLPFGVLGAAGKDAMPPQWLARRYAFGVLPSVSALRALRTFSRGKSGNDPFAGFGDPVLKGEPGSRRGLGVAQVFTTRSIAASTNTSNSALADVEVLREAPPLPETADELRALSATLHGSPRAIYLQAQATEARVKQTDLSHYRFLAFATHGVMAGELSGPAEPGLVLTPPLTASALDDGYLSASEVAQLRLNADWVLLSACNTASPDGSPGAEGLSGLAKAFFYAGSRSLLVSNWPVASKATQILITTTMKTYADAPDKGKPEALRSAMLEMMDQPEYSHPFFWAPFSVVGE